MKKAGRKPTRRQKKSPAARLERIPPTAPSARDEGPRLIPLGDSSKEPSRLDHYLELADRALGVKRINKSETS